MLRLGKNYEQNLLKVELLEKQMIEAYLKRSIFGILFRGKVVWGTGIFKKGPDEIRSRCLTVRLI